MVQLDFSHLSIVKVYKMGQNHAIKATSIIMITELEMRDRA